MLGKVAALTHRELSAHFLSPVAYIVAAVFLVAMGQLFMSNTLVEGGEASMRAMLDSMAWLLVFAIPMLTMRLLADEFSSGTIETLMTAPVTDIDVVAGKFLGVFLFYLVLLLTTIVHVVLLNLYGSQDLGIVLYGYLGMLLLGALYVSVGLFASSLTRHQLLAALIGIGILAVFTVLVDSFASWKGGDWRVVLGYVNILHHFKDFSRGIFDTKAVAFFLSSTAFFLFLSVKVLESRRWR
ncbi:MAG: ABC transporter permease [Phycisphaerae bacterium]